ncbi:MAG: hypothetical protein MK111_18330 [Crocosphaera sp.]|uniref:hypothetical protein n=1 Tax=Crocosphaera sp. TaxID=2729996 RepID=UPI00258604CC|nr:hypothetical protein [Crocosphaera sp.]MCH2246558.1 hypothetical protein [Crocosphaera sp.]
MANNKKQQRQKELQQDLIAKSQAEFFGYITKEEATKIFGILSVLSQFPGSAPPEPLTNCDITWTSTMKVGDSLDTQKFTVQAIYKDMTFIYTPSGSQTIHLPDSSFMNMMAWDYHAMLIANRILENWK